MAKEPILEPQSSNLQLSDDLRQIALDIANGVEIGNVRVLDAAARLERWGKALHRIDVLAPESPTPGSGVYLGDIAYRMGEIAREALRGGIEMTVRRDIGTPDPEIADPRVGDLPP